MFLYFFYYEENEGTKGKRAFMRIIDEVEKEKGIMESIRKSASNNELMKCFPKIKRLAITRQKYVLISVKPICVKIIYFVFK